MYDLREVEDAHVECEVELDQLYPYGHHMVGQVAIYCIQGVQTNQGEGEEMANNHKNIVYVRFYLQNMSKLTIRKTNKKGGGIQRAIR